MSKAEEFRKAQEDEATRQIREAIINAVSILKINLTEDQFVGIAICRKELSDLSNGTNYCT